MSLQEFRFSRTLHVRHLLSPPHGNKLAGTTTSTTAHARGPTEAALADDKDLEVAVAPLGFDAGDAGERRADVLRQLRGSRHEQALAAQLSCLTHLCCVAHLVRGGVIVLCHSRAGAVRRALVVAMPAQCRAESVRTSYVCMQWFSRVPISRPAIRLSSSHVFCRDEPLLP